MAIYKVPQDVEAEDKLLGPFTFRQFIYLIIVAVMGFFAFVLWQLFPLLAVIPVPAILFFGALALPIRKDQPMETYLAAIVSFYIKPRIRLWDPDGVETRVLITAPKVVELSLTKDISEDEAERRFAYLAQIVDSRGWATRSSMQHTTGIEAPNNLNPDMYFETQESMDVFDENNSVGINIDERLEQSSEQYRQNIINNLHNPTTLDSPFDTTQNQLPQNYQPVDQPLYPTAPQSYTPQELTAPFIPSTDRPVGNLIINPYPTINQATITPPGQAQPSPNPEPINSPTNGVEKPFSPAIIELATNAPEDFSIATLASQAKRISEEEKELNGDEVIISLR